VPNTRSNKCQRVALGATVQCQALALVVLKPPRERERPAQHKRHDRYPKFRSRLGPKNLSQLDIRASISSAKPLQLERLACQSAGGRSETSDRMMGKDTSWNFRFLPRGETYSAPTETTACLRFDTDPADDADLVDDR